MNNSNPLIGKTIQSIDVTTDGHAVKFALETGDDVIARAEGDCCSETWIDSILLPALGLPATVTDVRDLEMPDRGPIEGRDVVAYYGLSIVTDKGEIIIDYRNDSNGYYGGNLAWPDDHWYSGVFWQNENNNDWRRVGGD